MDRFPRNKCVLSPLPLRGKLRRTFEAVPFSAAEGISAAVCVSCICRFRSNMTSESQLKYYDSMFAEVAYLRRILNTLRPSLYRPNCDWSEIAREQEVVLNTLRGDFAVKMTDLEQRLERNTVRIFGLKEEPGEDTYAVAMGYFRKLRAWVSESDIERCYRAGGNTSRPRPVVVRFTNDEARKRVWKRKEKVEDKVFMVEELCLERREVRRIAVQAFGEDRVYVKQGAVRVLMDDDREEPFYTLAQISNFLKERASRRDTEECCTDKE